MTLEEWVDPYPKPVVQEIRPNIFVVRDDMLGVGSKARFADYLIGYSDEMKDKKEVVYGSSPAQGFAQVSGPDICNRHGKKFVLFMAKRAPEKYTPQQIKGIELGAEYHWVPDGMLNVTQKRAKDYVAVDPESRVLLPIGLDHPLVVQSIAKVAKSLSIVPDIVWSVGSSGTLTRGLQLAWPEAEFHVVQVGHNMKPEESGKAIVHKSKYAFNKPVKKEDAPPYYSEPTYDAKVWRPFLDYYDNNLMGFLLPQNKKVLIWNVA